jgi:hypothetical protein
MIAEITTGGNSHCLHVVCRLGNLARAMKNSEDWHDVIKFRKKGGGVRGLSAGNSSNRDYYYTSVSFLLYKNMTVVLLNCILKLTA